MQTLNETNQKMEFDLLISQEEIHEKIAEVAKDIDRDFGDKDLVLVMIMKGAICFVADLIRNLNVAHALDFIYCSSFHNNERKELKIYGLDDVKIAGKDVLLVDDIFDSGTTVREVIQRLSEKGPASIKTVVLLSRITDRPHPYVPDYSLFDLEEGKFVVGYGLDYHEKYRGLPGIFVPREQG